MGLGPGRPEDEVVHVGEGAVFAPASAAAALSWAVRVLQDASPLQAERVLDHSAVGAVRAGDPMLR